MSDRDYNADSEDPEERVIAALRDVCDTFQGVLELHPSLAPHFGSVTEIYAAMKHSAYGTDDGYDSTKILESVAELAVTYRQVLFALLFALREAEKAQKALPKEKQEILVPLDRQRVRSLLADLMQLQIDGNVSLDYLRELQAEARSLLTSEDYRSPSKN